MSNNAQICHKSTRIANICTLNFLFFCSSQYFNVVISSQLFDNPELVYLPRR